jgi:hypothetical protein
MKNINDSEHEHIIAIDETLFNNANINNNYIMIVLDYYYDALFLTTLSTITNHNNQRV